MDKAKNFQQAMAAAKEQITYADIIEMFNDLNKILGGEFYASANDLDRPEGGKAIGFVYTGYMAGVGLRKILDKIGIKYSTFMKGGTGASEESEIHIDKSDEQMMRKIMSQIGHMQSNQTIEINVRNGINIRNNPLFQNIR